MTFRRPPNLTVQRHLAHTGIKDNSENLQSQGFTVRRIVFNQTRKGPKQIMMTKYAGKHM